MTVPTIVYGELSANWQLVLRIAFPLAAVLVSTGFFGSAIGQGVTQPTSLIMILYSGAALLVVSVVFLGVGLLRSR